ncbi:hypothetical protein AtNW77_Chr2g0256691 [Arabidopsis thaliana]|uniref:Transmembrane protein n=3 Tax=Arabidopsis TaxID=3701 RepID=Q9ZQP7_ARATH|nr:uncharacterized protein AT2G35750 [Arabidopsis thaliana]AAD15440.1 unknown protein [Arabidopsis thaliana]AEC09156.1 transmembrane protein [Arabidopsis thaliana]KAG7638618.1 hypothetical protein ISN45_At02g030420 [Arabidopsis thaliana x Arabidopsis arenosa]OAP11093.1 hypothetical protein AXX17_AT2G32400 [Arabidopsis thaliana]|eukprot:NP_181118.1 transmembrane protein [Arabidopsis thaliana]
MPMDVDGALGLLRFGYLAIGSHIPLPCGAASLLLPFGTGHEIYIPLYFGFQFYLVRIVFSQ